MAQQPERIPPEKVEILPPEKGDQPFGRASYSSGQGTVKIIRLGPLGAIAMVLAFGLISAIGVLFLSGMLLILFAALVILGGGAYVANRLRGFWRFPR